MGRKFIQKASIGMIYVHGKFVSSRLKPSGNESPIMILG